MLPIRTQLKRARKKDIIAMKITKDKCFAYNAEKQRTVFTPTSFN
jgi:hypothetical protein